MGLMRDLNPKPYEVVWSGERRRYLMVDEQPAVRAERRAVPRQQATVTESWLAGEHYREDDSPRLRMLHSVRCANAPFTVQELAQAARVSKTLVRRFLDDCVRRKECRLAGQRPTARTRADLYMWVPAGSELIELSTATITVNMN